MAVKSIIDIEVNDAKFKEFAALFGKYRESLKEVPGDWAAIGEEIGTTRGLFEGLLAGMLTQHQLAERVTKQERAGELATRNTANYWKAMAKSTRDVAGNIFRATESLLKWIGLGGIISGILGAGGLYGIDRMAGSVAQGRGRSLGLGTTYGGLKAFSNAYAPAIGDTGGFLSAVSAGVSGDLEVKQAMLGAGMSASEMHGDTADVAVRLLHHLKTFADTHNDDVLALQMPAFGIDKVMSLEQMKQLRGTTSKEMGQYDTLFGDEQKRLNVARGTQSAWTSFEQQMKDAGTEIENVFVNALLPLEEPLKDLSKVFVDFVKKLSEDGTLKSGIDELGHGIEWLAGELRDGSIKKAFSSAVVDIGIIVHKLAEYAQFFDADAWNNAHPKEHGDALFQGTDFMERPYLRRPAAFSADGIISNRPSLIDFDRAHAQSGLPASLFASLANVESSGDPNAYNQKTGATGLLQFMAATAHSLGINPRDPSQALEGGGRLMNENLLRFHDVDMALAAWNVGKDANGKGGPERVAAAVAEAKRHNGDWRANMPEETRNFISKVERGMPSADLAAMRAFAASLSRGTTVNVNVTAPSGSSVTVQQGTLAGTGG